MVYGLPFCEEHGAEATAGALGELYQDASDFLEQLDNPHVPAPNAEVEGAFRAAMGDLEARRAEHEDAEAAALRRAYLEIPERVCSATVDFGYRYGPGNTYGPRDQPTEAFQEARRLTHKLMRLAYEEEADWLVEILEYERARGGVGAAGLRPRRLREEGRQAGSVAADYLIGGRNTFELNSLVLQVCHCIDQVPQRSTQPVKPPDYKGVTGLRWESASSRPGRRALLPLI